MTMTPTTAKTTTEEGLSYTRTGGEDDSHIFQVDGHRREAFSVMNELRQANDLCDITLHVGGTRFRAHKIVLASCSPYFRAMFTHDFDEKHQASVEMKDVAPCVFSALVDFAYTSRLVVSHCNVSCLLQTACMLQITQAVEACAIFLEHQLVPENCIEIAEFASQFSCQGLERKARQFMVHHFGEVAQTKEFVMLSGKQFCQLIKHDGLKVMCESEVYTAIIRWVRHDQSARHCYLEQLLGDVRYPLLTPEFIQTQLRMCPMAKCEKKCKDYLVNIFKHLTLHRKPAGCATTLCPRAQNVIYMAGGYLQHSLSYMDCYYPQGNRWRRLAGLPEPRSGLAAASIHGKVYIVGGRNNSSDGNMDSNRCDCYDPAADRWQVMASMNQPRNRVGIGVIDEMLYAIGGSQGCHHHNTVERYKLSENRWEMVAPMHHKRIGVGCASVNRLLYAIGGYNGADRLRSVECYYPETNQWKLVAPMATARSGAGVVAVGNYVYVVGGYDGSNQLSSVERYDTEKDLWTPVAPMHSRRSALSVAAVFGKIYALGGYDGQDFLASVEVYHPPTDTWTVLTSMHSNGRSGAGVAVGMEPTFDTPIACHSSNS